MEARWSDLCRSCLSPDTEVSLFDSEHNVIEKFFQVTTIKVSLDDGLPQNLCKNCFTVMETAYQFRNQCLSTDSELKEKIQALLEKSDSLAFHRIDSQFDTSDSDFANDPVKQLEAIIKQEPGNDDDENDDCYYVLVIDDPKEKDSMDIKSESFDETLKDLSPLEQNPLFEESIDSFLVKNSKIPDNVPATILENEETQDSEDNFEEHMNIDEMTETQNSNSKHSIEHTEDSQDNFDGEIIDPLSSVSKNNIFNIISAGNGKTYVLKDENGIQYLTDAQFISNDEGNSIEGDEVILYDGDCEDPSQLQLKYEGSELIIEYTDDGQTATVVQKEDGSFVCECGEIFQDIDQYEKHRVDHNPSSDNLCNVCGKGFESPEILTGHMLLHSVSGILVQCPFCNQLVKRNVLTQHIKYSHNNIKPKCNECGKTFANPNNLKRHMMIHSGIREFECDICHKSFHQKITMQTHRLTHVNPFACNQCDLTFDNAEGLNQHKESGECTKSKVEKVKEELMKTIKQLVTTNVGKILGYACSLCKKMFSLESVLEQHIESTHILDPSELLCSECGEVQPSKKEMHSHLLTHKNVKLKNVKRFECGICNKGCSSQAMLLMHERVHTNERPFPCHLCALRFKTKTHLRTHQLTHTREKKFGCPICKKFFALKGNLVVHLRTHTGERPYVCSLCNESFIDSKYLKKHKQRKHDIGNVPWNQY